MAPSLLLIIGMGNRFMRMIRVNGDEAPYLLAAVNVTFVVPVSSGVPVIIPEVAFNFNPGGNVDEENRIGAFVADIL